MIWVSNRLVVLNTLKWCIHEIQGEWENTTCVCVCVCVRAIDRRDAQRWGCGAHNSLQRLTHASNLIHNFKVAPYRIAEAISPDTSKGHTSLDISRSERPKTLHDLLTRWGSEKCREMGKKKYIYIYIVKGVKKRMWMRKKYYSVCAQEQYSKNRNPDFWIFQI